MDTSDFPQRVLRIWSWAAAAHALTIAIPIAALVPWKTPWVNVGLLVYAALQAAVAGGLRRRARWGWRLGVLSALLGLGACILIVGGLLLSWLYLHAIYGPFGYGASMVSLLIAAVAFQLLGLVPALQLRALLRREVRAHFSSGRLAQHVMAVLLSIPLVLAPIAYFPFRLRPMSPVEHSARDQAIAVLRAALRNNEPPPATALDGVPVGIAPLYVTLWFRGKAVARVRGGGADLHAAISEAAIALKRHPGVVNAYGRGRIKVDRVTAVGPVLSELPPVLALSVVPGADGLRRGDEHDERVLLPDDMVRGDHFGTSPLLPGLAEVRLGLDAGWALERLRGPEGQLQRLAIESWVETEHGALPVVRGNTPLPPSGADGFRDAAIRAGKLMLRTLRRDGSFGYRYYPFDHRQLGSSAQSLPRHAGTIYCLSQLHERTGDRRFARAALKAAQWLLRRHTKRCGEHRCVGKGADGKLGSSALSLIGLLELQRATGSKQLETPARELAAFVLSMQKPNGDFHHVYDRQRGAVDATAKKMFASEQAALALVLAHKVLGGEEPFLPAAERALDHLTGPKYDYFLGWFSYGADHWTCIAAEQAWPHLKSKRYLDFCTGYSAFVRRLQLDEDHPALSGHYGFTAVLVPQAPATAGFTEAVVSTYLLSRHHGEANAELRSQAVRALEALRRDQLRADNSYLARSPTATFGSIRRSLVQQEVRIDFLQHAASALIRGTEL